MKKFLALLLAVMMIASMSITAFAASAAKEEVTNTTTTTSTQSVTVVSSTAGSVPVYHVLVEWKALHFTYAFASGAVWDPSSHTYKNEANGAGTWSATNGTAIENGVKITSAINVENHSNAQVWIKATYAQETQNYGVNADVSDKDTFHNLANAEGTTYDKAPAKAFDVSVTGVPTQNDEFPLGTVTLTLSADDPNPNP